MLDGVAIEAGTPGAAAPVRIAGPMVSPGYWGEPDREEWLETSDLGFFDDDGRLHVVGRSDDVIVSGGENIHPAEVEAALQALPGVSAAAVFGVPDELWGERVEAAVVVGEATMTVESIEAALRQHLADFKIPKRWHVVDELPLGPIGKVERARLIELATVDNDLHD